MVLLGGKVDDERAWRECWTARAKKVPAVWRSLREVVQPSSSPRAEQRTPLPAAGWQPADSEKSASTPSSQQHGQAA
jgi:hypothetical protein